MIRGGKGNGKPEELLAKVPGLSAIWREGKDGSLRHLAGDASLQVPWFGETVELPGGGFVQVNREAGENLHAQVRGKAGDVKGVRVVDAYCGAGALGKALARDGAEVVGIESDPAAVRVAEAMAPPGFRVVGGRVEDRLADLLPADLLLLNPPRTGLARVVPDIVAGQAPPRVVYVSCDPATLSRDLGRLGRTYRLEALTAFDLFPQTAHVEAVALLERKDDWVALLERKDD